MGEPDQKIHATVGDLFSPELVRSYNWRYSQVAMATGAVALGLQRQGASWKLVTLPWNEGSQKWILCCRGRSISDSKRYNALFTTGSYGGFDEMARLGWASSVQYAAAPVEACLLAGTRYYRRLHKWA